MDGEVVGSLGLETSARPRLQHSGSIGMAVRDDFQNRGVGSALIRAVLDLADDWLALSRVALTVFVDNAAAAGAVREVRGDAYTMARLRG